MTPIVFLWWFACNMVVAFVVLHVPLACSIYPWKNILIEKSFLRFCSYLWLLVILSQQYLCVLEFCFNETKVALFFWSKLSRNQLRLPLVLPSLQVSDKPQDDDGAGFLELGKFIYSKTTPQKNRNKTISDLFWAMTNCSK